MIRSPPPWTRWLLAGCAALLTGGPAGAQLLGGAPGGGLTGGLGGTVGSLAGAVGDLPAGRRLPQDLARTAKAALADARQLAAARLIREHPEAVEADEHGAPVVRGEVLVLAPGQDALAAAARAGFRIGDRLSLPDLGVEGLTLIAPPGLSSRAAVARLRALDPAGQYDYDHIYQESGETGPGGPPAVAAPAPARGPRLGLVDGSADAAHPALRGARLEQAAFAPGGGRVTAHATAAASLMVGEAGAFRGTAPGAQLLVADVYGPTPAGGSAAAIVKGLGWLAERRVGVINISLVGPPNLLLGAAVKGLVGRGVLLVAAVGNDGPAAPPLYPAAYPGVVAVTAVDARRRPLPEAGRGPHVAFAAPGAQMAAAAPGGGFAEVRGTSFAAPLVAGTLARDLPAPDPAAARRAVEKLAATAQDLGAPGRDRVFGYGLVDFAARTDPARVGARGLALRAP